MRKTYKLENLDCANCAAKMETAIGKISGVDSCTISFMSQKITIEAADDKMEELLEEAQKAIKKVDRSCKIVK